MKVYIISFILVAASVAALLFMDVRYDFYIILSCVIVAALGFVAGWYEARSRYKPPRKRF